MDILLRDDRLANGAIRLSQTEYGTGQCTPVNPSDFVGDTGTKQDGVVHKDVVMQRQATCRDNREAGIMQRGLYTAHPCISYT